MNGYKTIAFNILLVITGLAAEAGIALPETFAADLNGWIMTGIGLGGIALRAVTDSPVGLRK